jgi:uncharacterized membrane protein YphA (DoxX/SURF4 family)
MNSRLTHTISTIFIALVWIINGLFCKVLTMEPRHEAIVERILSLDRASANFMTFLIGILEIFMAIWILSRIKSKLNAITQMVIIATMNLLEFVLVPDLLLWGRFNLVFALLFILFIYYNEFHLNKKIIQAA